MTGPRIHFYGPNNEKLWIHSGSIIDECLYHMGFPDHYSKSHFLNWLSTAGALTIDPKRQATLIHTNLAHIHPELAYMYDWVYNRRQQERQVKSHFHVRNFRAKQKAVHEEENAALQGPVRRLTCSPICLDDPADATRLQEAHPEEEEKVESHDHSDFRHKQKARHQENAVLQGPATRLERSPVSHDVPVAHPEERGQVKSHVHVQNVGAKRKAAHRENAVVRSPATRRSECSPTIHEVPLLRQPALVEAESDDAMDEDVAEATATFLNNTELGCSKVPTRVRGIGVTLVTDWHCRGGRIVQWQSGTRRATVGDGLGGTR